MLLGPASLHNPWTDGFVGIVAIVEVDTWRGNPLVALPIFFARQYRLRH